MPQKSANCVFTLNEPMEEDPSVLNIQINRMTNECMNRVVEYSIHNSLPNLIHIISHNNTILALNGRLFVTSSLLYAVVEQF